MTAPSAGQLPADCRWACPKCGRFIASVYVQALTEHGQDGIGTRTIFAATCGWYDGCGTVEPVQRPHRKAVAS
jgi:hypothetical protein